uniref:Uncharacterized protein n=1 Tax=uncultured marine thaumarchaeote AD1000_33_B07 TaxID=1455908 RepID=A0A075FNL5_9ARCH|nr:hypothetical protein [uncultured marine thaumarchaeote AD1000_33_B07]
MPFSKLKKDIEAAVATNLLVICVDRDDDVGKRLEFQLQWLEEMLVLKRHKD